MLVQLPVVARDHVPLDEGRAEKGPLRISALRGDGLTRFPIVGLEGGLSMTAIIGHRITHQAKLRSFSRDVIAF